MTTTTLAWHGDPDLKREVMARLRQHRREDSIVQGFYQLIDPDLASGYRGCAIGCTLPPQPHLGKDGEVTWPDGGWYAQVQSLYGIPERIASLIDDAFEQLPTGSHADFAVNVIDVIPVGADLSHVVDRVILEMITDEGHGALQWADGDDDLRRAVEAVVALLRRRLDRDEPDSAEWKQAFMEMDARADSARGYAFDLCMLVAAACRDMDPEICDHDTVWVAERLTHHLSTAPVPEVSVR